MPQKTLMVDRGCSFKSFYKTTRFLLLVLIAVFTVLNYLQIFNITAMSKVMFEKSADNPEYLIDTPGCRMPKFDPFHPSVAYYYKNLTSDLWKCHEGEYLLVDGDSIYLNVTLVQRDFNTSDVYCHYQPIARVRKDQLVSSSPDDIFLIYQKQNLTFGTSMSDEFVLVTCYSDGGDTTIVLFEDYLAFAPLKEEVEAVRAPAADEYLSETPLSVILLAIDSVSKLNFIRQFQKTHEFLRDVLKPLEFHGHTKVADNTHVNIVPLLTGYFISEYRSMKNISTTFYDDLDLVWRDFADLGYRTLYSEDYPNWGTFTYQKKGFLDQPTDYYFRPLVLAMEHTEWRVKNGIYCCGHTSEPEFHYDYLRRFLKAMDTRPFFAFTFVSRASHNDLNKAKLFDDPTYELLRDLRDSGVLDRSVLIFLSDHGIRYGEIRNTYIGKIEERMPFMFQHYPKWFLEKHPDIAENLVTNQRRLTTVFDVHKTMLDIMMVSLKSNQRQNPVLTPDNMFGHGQSLFKELPATRTCNDAYIHPHWCTCHDRREIPITDPKVIAAAQVIIQTINVWTNVSSSFPQQRCAELSVDYIIDAYVTSPSSQQELKETKNAKLEFDWLISWDTRGDITKEEKAPLQSSDIKWSSETYLVTIGTLPGQGVFEATLMQIGGEFVVLGDISRINSYGETSWCVKSPILKKYCYCTVKKS